MRARALDDGITANPEDASNAEPPHPPRFFKTYRSNAAWTAADEARAPTKTRGIRNILRSLRLRTGERMRRHQPGARAKLNGKTHALFYFIKRLAIDKWFKFAWLFHRCIRNKACANPSEKIVLENLKFKK